jgi:hypothetical protein
MYVYVCLYVCPQRRHIASSPSPAVADPGGGGVRWGWRAVVVARDEWVSVLVVMVVPVLVAGAAAVVLGGGRDGGGCAGWWQGRQRGVLGGGRGGGGGGLSWVLFSFFVFEKNLRRELIGPLGACPPRGAPHALGKELFAGGAAP